MQIIQENIDIIFIAIAAFVLFIYAVTKLQKILIKLAVYTLIGAITVIALQNIEWNKVKAKYTSGIPEKLKDIQLPENTLEKIKQGAGQLRDTMQNLKETQIPEQSAHSEEREPRTSQENPYRRPQDQENRSGSVLEF